MRLLDIVVILWCMTNDLLRGSMHFMMGPPELIMILALLPLH